MPNLPGVRDRRRRTGVKIGKFALMAGYARSTLTSIENGTRSASPEGAERIAQALTDLGVPTVAEDLLVDGTVPDEPPKQPIRPKAPPKRQDREQDRKGPKRAVA
jgi:transcriptional regulator with XRE-family HTH domain